MTKRVKARIDKVLSGECAEHRQVVRRLQNSLSTYATRLRTIRAEERERACRITELANSKAEAMAKIRSGRAVHRIRLAK